MTEIKKEISRNDLAAWSNENIDKVKELILNRTEDFEGFYDEFHGVINETAIKLYAEDRNISLNEALKLIGRKFYLTTNDLFS